MDLSSRIRRRQQSGDETRVVLDYHAISPVAHFEEPTGRGSVFERLLDYVEPVFGSRIPPNAYIWGPPGSGKSAIITALFSYMNRSRPLSDSLIHTSTRGGTSTTPGLVYVDTRDASSEFRLYQSILDGVLEESVPKHGVGTAALRSRLDEYLTPHNHSVLVAVDHIDEPGTQSLAAIADSFEELSGSLSWLAIGRQSPSALAETVQPPEHIEVPAYRDPVLVDILTTRASEGVAHQAIEHEQLRRIAEWSDGNAHDALCVLFAAADEAATEGASRIRERDLHAGMDAVPHPSAPLGRVLALSDNRQLVLRHLVDTDDEQRSSVDAAATTIAASPDVDLSTGTVKRLLYELAEAGVAERVTSEHTMEGSGRSPSRLEPRFPTRVFRRLYDLSHS
jgi:Cdc6-like AAA superfamily ATPase